MDIRTVNRNELRDAIKNADKSHQDLRTRHAILEFALFLRNLQEVCPSATEVGIASDEYCNDHFFLTQLRGTSSPYAMLVAAPLVNAVAHGTYSTLVAETDLLSPSYNTRGNSACLVVVDDFLERSHALLND